MSVDRFSIADIGRKVLCSTEITAEWAGHQRYEWVDVIRDIYKGGREARVVEVPFTVAEGHLVKAEEAQFIDAGV